MHSILSVFLGAGVSQTVLEYKAETGINKMVSKTLDLMVTVDKISEWKV